MPDLAILARAPLPEPLTYVLPLFRADGLRAVVLGDSGRLWLLDADPERRTAVFQPLPITIPEGGRGERRLTALAGSHTLDRLLVWSDRLRVHALPSGEVLYENESPGEGAACLSPSGRFVICLGEEGGWTVYLAATPLLPWKTEELHRGEEPFARADGGDGAADPPEPEPVFLDDVEHLVAHPSPDAPDRGWSWGPEIERERFWLAAGCYGFVLVHQVNGSDWGVERVPGDTRSFGGLVYDPTEPVRPFGARHLFVLHGHRCGLAALDPETGEVHHCAVRREGHPYAFFHAVAVCADSPRAVVTCRDGAFLWEPGVRLDPLPGLPGLAWALYRDVVLCAAGAELLWVTLPGS